MEKFISVIYSRNGIQPYCFKILLLIILRLLFSETLKNPVNKGNLNDVVGRAESICVVIP